MRQVFAVMLGILGVTSRVGPLSADPVYLTFLLWDPLRKNSKRPSKIWKP